MPRSDVIEAKCDVNEGKRDEAAKGHGDVSKSSNDVSEDASDTARDAAAVSDDVTQGGASIISDESPVVDSEWLRFGHHMIHSLQNHTKAVRHY